MMSTSCGTEIASMRAAVGEKIVGRQRNADGRTAFQLYIYIKYIYLNERQFITTATTAFQFVQRLLVYMCVCVRMHTHTNC